MLAKVSSAQTEELFIIPLFQSGCDVTPSFTPLTRIDMAGTETQQDEQHHPTAFEKFQEEREAFLKAANYPLVEKSDMNQDMRTEAIEMCTVAAEKHAENYERAAMLIKESMDKKYGAPWHVVLGAYFSFEVTYEVGIPNPPQPLFFQAEPTFHASGPALNNLSRADAGEALAPPLLRGQSGHPPLEVPVMPIRTSLQGEACAPPPPPPFSGGSKGRGEPEGGTRRWPG